MFRNPICSVSIIGMNNIILLQAQGSLFLNIISYVILWSVNITWSLHLHIHLVSKLNVSHNCLVRISVFVSYMDAINQNLISKLITYLFNKTLIYIPCVTAETGISVMNVYLCNLLHLLQYFITKNWTCNFRKQTNILKNSF